MIPILMGIFALGGTTYGMAEESRAFYALVITAMIATGYDAGRRRRGPARRSGDRHLIRAALHPGPDGTHKVSPCPMGPRGEVERVDAVPGFRTQAFLLHRLAQEWGLIVLVRVADRFACFCSSSRIIRNG